MKKTGTQAPPAYKTNTPLWKRALPMLLIFLLSIGAAWWANRPDPGQAATSASLRRFVPARVVRVVQDDAEPDSWTEGLRIGTQLLEVRLERGEFKGTVLETPNFLNAYYNIDVAKGDRILAYLDTDEQGVPYIASVYSYYRTPVLIGLVLAFFTLLILLGRGKGVRALVGLLFTLGALWFLLIPLLQKGWPTIPLTILITALTAAVTLILLTGYCKKTLCAIIGCVGGVSAAGLTAALVGFLTPINGFNMPEAEDLILRAADRGLTVSGLLISGILISSLGAVMDVAMSISSACSELVQLNPQLDRWQVFRSGMNIGRDAMGTMANTLILAFTGASLNTLILFRVFNYPYQQLINSDMMVIELIQGLSGSIGILLTVPLVAAVSAWLMTKKPGEKDSSAPAARSH